MTNVLVAEDNPVNRELLRELLEGRGYNVIDVNLWTPWKCTEII